MLCKSIRGHIRSIFSECWGDGKRRLKGGLWPPNLPSKTIAPHIRILILKMQHGTVCISCWREMSHEEETLNMKVEDIYWTLVHPRGLLQSQNANAGDLFRWKGCWKGWGSETQKRKCQERSLFIKGKAPCALVKPRSMLGEGAKGCSIEGNVLGHVPVNFHQPTVEGYP